MATSVAWTKDTLRAKAKINPKNDKRRHEKCCTFIDQIVDDNCLKGLNIESTQPGHRMIKTPVDVSLPALFAPNGSIVGKSWRAKVIKCVGDHEPGYLLRKDNKLLKENPSYRCNNGNGYSMNAINALQMAMDCTTKKPPDMTPKEHCGYQEAYILRHPVAVDKGDEDEQDEDGGEGLPEDDEEAESDDESGEGAVLPDTDTSDTEEGGMPPSKRTKSSNPTEDEPLAKPGNLTDAADTKWENATVKKDTAIAAAIAAANAEANAEHRSIILASKEAAEEEEEEFLDQLIPDRGPKTADVGAHTRTNQEELTCTEPLLREIFRQCPEVLTHYDIKVGNNEYQFESPKNHKKRKMDVFMRPKDPKTHIFHCFECKVADTAKAKGQCEEYEHWALPGLAEEPVMQNTYKTWDSTTRAVAHVHVYFPTEPCEDYKDKFELHGYGVQWPNKTEWMTFLR